MPTEATHSERKENDPCNDGRDQEHEQAADSKQSFQRALLWEEELRIRALVSKGVLGSAILAPLVNTYSSFLIFAIYLISLESLASIALSAGLTIFAYRRADENPDFDGSTMNWTLLSFAVITPVSASVTMAFKRRERALEHLAVIKSTLLNIYSAHVIWDWTKSGKDQTTGRITSSVNWLEHTDSVLMTIMALGGDLTRLLTIPSGTRARHRVSSCFQEQAREIDDLLRKLHRAILSDFTILSEFCEVLKTEGLPPNEATRIRQWEQFIADRVERLLVIKRYRTPQALRSFARLFTVFLPPFYAPYYGQLALSLNSLGMGIAFATLTSIALTSLFESISQMEDPFIGIIAVDGIDVRKELTENFQDQLLDLRSHIFSDAKPFDVPRLHRAPDLPRGPKLRLFQGVEM